MRENGVAAAATREHLADNLRVATVQLDDEARQELTRSFPLGAMT